MSHDFENEDGPDNMTLDLTLSPHQNCVCAIRLPVAVRGAEPFGRVRGLP